MSCYCPLCTDAPGDEIATQVAGEGWHLTAVLPGDQPGWAYSVGLWHTSRHPEVAIFGLPASRFGLVNVAAESVREGRRLRPGGVLEDMLIGYPMQVRAVDPTWRWLFPRALDFYPAPQPDMLQLVWPDQDGHYPWDRRFAESHRESQPHLWLPAEDHPPGVWTRLRRRQQASQRQP